MKNWGIQTRVLFLALVPLTVIVLSISVHFVLTRLHDLDRALQDRGQAIASGLAPACEYGVVSGNRAILSNLAQALLAEPDVVAVSITDMRGAVLGHARSRTSLSASESNSTASAEPYLFRAPIYQSQVVFEPGLGQFD